MTTSHCKAPFLSTTRFNRNGSAAAKFKCTAGWEFEPHRCFVRIVNPGQGISVALTGYDDEPMELDCLLFEIVGEMLHEGGFRAKADGMPPFPILVPTEGRFELGINTEFFRL